MFDQDSSSVVRSLIGNFAFRSNPVSKAMVELWKWLGRRGVLERTVKYTAAGELTIDPFPNLLMEQARIEHAPNESLLTYITSVSALVN